MSKSINIVFLGSTKFSADVLKNIIKDGFNVNLVLGIPEYFNISYSDSPVKNYRYANLKNIADKYNIKFCEVNSVDGYRLNDYYNTIVETKPTIILAINWYYMISKKIRELSPNGVWCIHPSLLPKYAGGAPITWAIINGEERTGTTLFRLSDGVDDGDIIDQAEVSIGINDTISDIYTKIEISSKEIILKALNNIDSIEYKPQDKNLIEVWSQRSPEDGEIDLNKTAKEIHDFVRAQSSPYPGAFIKTIDNKKLIIEKTRIEDF